MGSEWEHLDRQLQRFSPSLREHLNIRAPDSNSVATRIAADLVQLQAEQLSSILGDDPIQATARRDELLAYQAFTDRVHAGTPDPPTTRALVLVQNYICFVYLGDALFKRLKKELPSGSVTKKCCKFLTDNPVRAFRNAVAHGNWTYSPDYGGLIYWARKGSDPNEAMSEFEVRQNDLNFWQALARCVAYVAYTHIVDLQA